MGQWLKAIGGYTVEQIGAFLFQYSFHCFVYNLQCGYILLCRQLPIGDDRLRYCINPRLCDMDRLYTSPLACPSLHVDCVHHLLPLYPCVGQSDWTEIFRVLCVRFCMSKLIFYPKLLGHPDLAGASYAGQATTFAYVYTNNLISS